MAAFEYVSLDKQGRRHNGVLEAESQRHARQLLRERLLTPLTLNEASGVHPKSTGRLRNQQSRIGLREVSVFTRQLATLIESGLPVEHALQALSRQSQKPAVKSMLAALRAQVLEGHSLAESMAAFPGNFSELYRTSVFAGERTGHLDTVLRYLADFSENALLLRQKILLALLYPAILTVVSLLIIGFLLVYIVPGMIRAFSDTGHTLPLLTRGLIEISNGIQAYGIYFLLAFLLAAMFIYRLVKRQEIRLKLDKNILSWPLIGNLINEYSAARYTSTLGMLQGSGVPLLQGLEISAAVVENRYIRKCAEELTRKVSEGISLSQAMEQGDVLPPVLISMTASGEASGQLGTMLARASAMLQRNVENRTAIVLGVFEPLVLLVMGGIVLLLVLAIILPILNLNQLVK